MIEFYVRMEPVAQGRPRFSTASGFAKAYDPAPSREAKKYIRLAAAEKMGSAPPMEGPLAVEITVCRAIPKSASQRKIRDMLAGRLTPTTKPDVSNYQKLVEDALNAVVWRDDSQIVESISRKAYSLTPGYKISVRPYVPPSE